MENIALTRKKLAILFIVGYIIAVLASVAVTVGLILLPSALPDDGKFGSFYQQLELILPIFVVGLTYTSISALPGYTASLFLAHKKNYHSMRFYLIAGVATAFLAHVLFALFVGDVMPEISMIYGASLVGGAAGAYAYFLWRKKMLSVWNC